jgi:hypothetical protein
MISAPDIRTITMNGHRLPTKNIYGGIYEA